MDNTLIKTDRDNYGEDYNSHLMEQYKLYVEMADRISARRQAANSYFLSINTAIVAFIGVSSKEGFSGYPLFWYLVIALAGIILCYSWYRLIRSYKDLNSGKFSVIHQIEAKLPLAPYDAEWKEIGEGKNPHKYLPFTHIEIRIPWIFMLLYTIIIIYTIIYFIVHSRQRTC